MAVRPAQQWLFGPLGNGNYNIINQQTLNCMRALTSAYFAAIETIDGTTISGEIRSINMVDRISDQHLPRHRQPQQKPVRRPAAVSLNEKYSPLSASRRLVFG